MGARLAIVGCGAVAERGHIPAARRLENGSLVALVDSDRARAEHLAQRFEIPKVFCSVAELAGEVDAVVLATPPQVRPALAEQAFSAGLHVLCEKPLANSVADCKIILDAGRRAKRVLAVAHNYRYMRNRIQVQLLLQEKALGAVLAVDLEQGDPADWPTRTGYSVRREQTPGGILLNEGIHSLDTLLWWFGGPLDLDYHDDAVGGLESNARIAMNFIDGISCKVRLSRTCTLENRILIEGETGSLSVPLYDQSRFSLTRNGRTSIHNVTSLKWDFVTTMNEQLKDFVASIETMTPPRITGEDGMRVIEVIEKCYAAKRLRGLPERAPAPGLTW